MKRGQAIVEYALIIMLLGGVLVGVLFSLGAVERRLFLNIAASVNATTPITSPTPTPKPTPTNCHQDDENNCSQEGE